LEKSNMSTQAVSSIASANGSLREPIDRVLDALRAAQCEPTKVRYGWKARCPAHDDTKPSLDVNVGDVGTVLVTCRSQGCTFAKIAAALKLEEADFFRHQLKGQPKSKAKSTRRVDYDHPVAIYLYEKPDGSPAYQVRRLKVLNQAGKVVGKTFVQYRPDGSGWKPGLGKIETILYQLPELVAASPDEPAWIPEGEKDVKNLRAFSRLATCNPMGAGKWKDSYSESLRDRHCLIVPDNDQVGNDHAQQVARSLHGKAASVKILNLLELMPDLPAKGDVSDFLERGGTVDQLDELAHGTAEWTPPAAEEKSSPEPKEDQSHAAILKRIAATAGLFKTPAGDGYITIKVNGRAEHHPVDSRAVELWLTYEFMEQVDRAPSAESLAQIVSTLKARALFSRVEIPIGIRVAPDPTFKNPAPVYYVDLGNERGQVVRISAAGWTIVDDAPVKFRRPKGMGKLPMPERGGSLDALWRFVNIEKEDRILFIATLTYYLLPVAPKPIVVMAGEQGSCKSTATEVMKRCVDPTRPMLGSPPGDIRDLAIIANNSWVAAFDNLSKIPSWFSDGLCRLAYGTGFQTRTLHTNDELTSFEGCRPVVINGIDDLAQKHDLLSRSEVFNCPRLKDEQRLPDEEFWAAFEDEHPRIFGSLLDAIAGGLAALPTIEKTSLPRMATFGRWGEAVAQYLSEKQGAFLEAFRDNQQSASAELLEDSPLFEELVSMGRLSPTWSGPPKELFRALNDQASPATRSTLKWPKGPQSLSCHLKRLAPGLRKQGIQVELEGRKGQSRLIQIRWKSEDTSPPNKEKNAPNAPNAPSGCTRGAFKDLPQGEPRKGFPF
jgi:hypothetical protein